MFKQVEVEFNLYHCTILFSLFLAPWYHSIWHHLFHYIYFRWLKIIQDVVTVIGELLEILLKKKRNLDETGLEILGCRHTIAQAAVNMFYGEVYGYAHYLQKMFLIPKKVQFLWYDVICKYWPWLRKTDPTCVQSMKPALSVMHAKAHAWTCQV